MDIVALSQSDLDAMWTINEQGLPGQARFRKRNPTVTRILIHFSGAYDQGELLGFVICLPPKTAYGSLNYAWFNEHYTRSFTSIESLYLKNIETKVLDLPCTIML